MGRGKLASSQRVRASPEKKRDPRGVPHLLWGFFLISVFSRPAATFNVAGRRMVGRCWTVFYVAIENWCR